MRSLLGKQNGVPRSCSSEANLNPDVNQPSVSGNTKVQELRWFRSPLFEIGSLFHEGDSPQAFWEGNGLPTHPHTVAEALRGHHALEPRCYCNVKAVNVSIRSRLIHIAGEGGTSDAINKVPPGLYRQLAASQVDIYLRLCTELSWSIQTQWISSM